MTAGELISDAMPPVKTSDSVQKVLDRMAEFRVSHMPIVNNEQFLGLISDDDLIEAPDYDSPIGGLNLSLTNASIRQEQHVYNVIRLAYELKLTVVPVLDALNNYIGLVSINTLVEYIAAFTAAKEPGGIIVLEISSRENSLAHMAQIVESNNAQVLSSYIRDFPDSTRLEVTLKVNYKDVSAIAASFDRFNYTVKNVFSDAEINSGSKGRYDQLMNYLNM